MSNPVNAMYQRSLLDRGYHSDSAQLHAVSALDQSVAQWTRYIQRRRNPLTNLFTSNPIARGIYMYGGVGRGKSFLMDCFFQAVPLARKTRLHFHEFMREVHRELAEMHGTVNPLEVLAGRIAKRHRLICFDEFHVSDVTDAMILHRLLDAFFANNVGIVCTSNFHPDGLYPNGLHRERILPAIELIKKNLDIISVDNGVDYRGRTLEQVGTYHCPLNEQAQQAMQLAFEQLMEVREESEVLHIEHRELRARRRAGGVVWFDFKALCGGPRSQNDYLELASRFHTILLSDVPAMPIRLAAEARRFTWLVDVMYDRHIKLIMSAQVVPEALYTEGPLVHEFARTVSRLREMQSAQFLALARRVVDTGLT